MFKSGNESGIIIPATSKTPVLYDKDLKTNKQPIGLVLGCSDVKLLLYTGQCTAFVVLHLFLKYKLREFQRVVFLCFF